MLNVKNLNVYCFQNATKKYLLKDITFLLKKGESLGIIGKSGSGKSTLAKALLKIYENNIYYEKGEIILNDIPFNSSFRGKKISLLFQNPNSYLNPLMKVGKQISEMLVYHYKERKKVAKAKAIEFMKKFGLKEAEKIYNYYPHEISGGMQQKICLCISLICNPEVLILDESTSFLDAETKEEILKLIKDIQKESKFSLIMISHDFKEIYSVCDKIAIMRNGSMIEFGNKKEIILKPIHPHTIELLLDYLRYYKNIERFNCPTLNIELVESAPITMISDTHYVRSWFLDKLSPKINFPKNITQLKEEIYENIRNKQP